MSQPATDRNRMGTQVGLTSNVYFFYHSHHLSFNCISVMRQRLCVSVTLWGSGLYRWHCTLHPECWGCLNIPFPLPREFLGETGGGDTVGNFIFFYEFSVTECTCVFACSGNTGVWCVTCFLLKLAFAGSWGYYWCFGRGVVKVGLTLACRRWFQVLCPGDVYANKKNALSSLQAKFRKIILALWIAKRKWKNRHGLGGRLGREEERKRR